MFKKSNRDIFIFLILFLFHLINNFIILRQDNVPLFFDEGGFYNLSINYYRYLFSAPNISKFFHHFYGISNFYPPLVFIERIPFYMVGGVSQDACVLANLPFLFILIYSAFLIGKYISNVKTGLLAAFLLSFYPGICGFSRTNFVTIPMAAAVAVSIYFLLRTEGFTKKKYSILLGISMGLGLLIKWLYLIYIFPPILVCFYESFRRHKERDFRKISDNILFAIAIGIIVALPWYLPNIKHIIPMMFSANYDNPNWVNYKMYFKANPFRWGLFKYIVLLEQYHMYTYYTVLFVCFLFRYIIAKNGSIKWMLLTSLALPYIIFNFTVIDYYSGELCPRYTIPLFTLAAIITAKGILEIKKDILRRSVIISIVLFGLIQFYWLPVSYSNVNRHIYTQEDFYKRTTSGLLLPKRVDWKIGDTIDTIRNNRISNKPNILIIPHTPLTSALAYKLELAQNNNVVFPLNATFVGTKYNTPPVEIYEDLIESANFVLTQKGGKLIYNDSAWLRGALNTIIEQFEHRKNEFILLKELKVDIDQEGTKILIYKRNKPEMNVIRQTEPEGEGILIRAVDFSIGNLTYNADFGLVIDGGVSPAYVIYEVFFPYGGNYELWVRYATEKVRPVDIYFDRVLKKAGALTTFTEGWTYFDSRWFKEVDIEAKRGRHTLKFIAHKTVFPHIDAIKLIYKPK